ncbi:MAG: nucleoside triphosphate pyrophosphohydrolase [Bdellovibrionaceae bacterium]|jgi:XTP/dITP diphosphohydrolase|nr:nucleoside triphosphate pyrophosphohydrolase [Pseudobdellovibrionaceae bacterium]
MPLSPEQMAGEWMQPAAVTSWSEEERQLAEQVIRLYRITQRLRDPQRGCPWDIKQTPQSLVPYLLEEAYEAAESILWGNSSERREELGDFLYQVVIQAQMLSERGETQLREIVQGLADKLVRRHPHVFSGVHAQSEEEVKALWQSIKAREKLEARAEREADLSEGESTQAGPEFSDLKAALGKSPLQAAWLIGQISARWGFDWSNADEVWKKVREEWAELQEAISDEEKSHELGDLLFALVQWGRHTEVDPALALATCTRRFVERVEKAWQLSGLAFSEFCQLPQSSKEEWYQRAKAALGP